MSTPVLSVREVRRLALARAGLLADRWTGLPSRAAGKGKRARRGCRAVIERFGYLQLDTVSVAGARTHGIVLASRLDGLDASVAETLLAPGAPLFEYWGHEACWIPLELYPHFAFRRREFTVHPWWGDVLGEHAKLARDIVRRIADEGPLRSVDLEGKGGEGWWDLKLSKRIAEALWSSGELMVRERRNFHRSFDLPERVLPGDVLSRSVSDEEAFDTLLLKALDGHGWATTGTLAATWRFRNLRAEVLATLRRLQESGAIVPCAMHTPQRTVAGWIRPADLELAADLTKLRPRRDRGVLLSPFDPVLWDRARVQALFGFEQVLEIYKPAPKRQYGYYCLPVLAGESLVGRIDLKAYRDRGCLEVRNCHYEGDGTTSPRQREAVDSALARYAQAVGLDLC
ncbi:MAG: winged helix-turn-helix domain-containing protein [Gammaproteobacteria bacterium]